MWLPDETFKSVIQHTPLISIDLIVRNQQGKVLLGQRINAPAKGYWFVPGGRIRKNESLDDAFVRLVKEELGIKSGLTRADAKFLGIFEHFYNDCVFNSEISTHYIVLAYELSVDNLNFLTFKQHSKYRWLEENLLMRNKEVNEFTVKYFL